MLRWLPLEAVKASYWHRVNLGDTDELVGGLIGSEGVLWPRLVADTAGRSEAENRRKIDLPAEARNVPSRPLMNVTITVRPVRILDSWDQSSL